MTAHAVIYVLELLSTALSSISQYVPVYIRYKKMGRIGLDEKQCISILEKEFTARKLVRKLFVICKDETLLKYEKGS